MPAPSKHPQIPIRNEKEKWMFAIHTNLDSKYFHFNSLWKLSKYKKQTKKPLFKMPEKKKNLAPWEELASRALGKVRLETVSLLRLPTMLERESLTWTWNQKKWSGGSLREQRAVTHHLRPPRLTLIWCLSVEQRQAGIFHKHKSRNLIKRYANKYR